jgi:AraC-like DNA-binding protein
MPGITKFFELQYRLEARRMTPYSRQFMAQVDDAILRGLPEASVSVETVASEVSVSPSKLRRQLQNATGISPAIYIMFVRLREALHLLEFYPQYSISEIALQCGFSDHSHFTHAFIRFFGCPPLQYIQEINSHY